MKKYSPALLSALIFSSLMMISPSSYAEDEQEALLREQELNAREQELNKREQELNNRTKSYSERVADKAWSGFTNLNTAPLEIPKSIITVTNDSGFVLLGLTAGLIKGTLHTSGRAVSGIIDLITAPILTKPIVQPERVWDDFDAETTYGPVFRLDNHPGWE